MDDPQFQHRFRWYPASQLVADQLPFPLKVAGEDVVDLTAAPEPGEHTESVLTDALGYDAEKIAALRAAGALGED
jgi:crotonobetainyl-CoA:carnitine CoA-transferase CaiB-like acyl-CoA transferase